MYQSNQDNKIFSDNPYQYTRGVRFRAKPIREGETFQEKYRFSDCEGDFKSSEVLSDLAKELLNFYTNLKGFIFFKEDEFHKNISVKKTWREKWYKYIFYLQIQSNNQNRYALKDLKELHDDFKERLDDWHKHSSQLQAASHLAKHSKHSQMRRSDIAESIKALLSRNLLIYFQDFLTESHVTAGLDEKVNSLKEKLETLQEQLKSAIQVYLPSQSSGIEIAKASLNYYTLNKKPKEYENKLQKKKAELSKNHYSKIHCSIKKETYYWNLNDNNFRQQSNNSNKQKKRREKELFQFNRPQEKEWLERYYKHKGKFEDDLKGGLFLSLNQTYLMMKAFKAEQKTIFYEIADHIANNKGSNYEVKNKNFRLKGHEFPYEELNMGGINKEFSLFQFVNKQNKKGGEIKSGDQYKKFIDLTKDIQKEKNAKNERGQFFFGDNCYFKEYGKFCKEYKNIAQKRGRIKAEIKGVEREKQEALQTDFWALIYCQKNKKQLWLVPKEKSQEARDFVYDGKRQKCVQGSHECLYSFESLTMRALHKLCFTEQSSFVAGMPDDLKSLQKTAKKFETHRDKNKLKEKDQKKLEFFKQLLKSNYFKETLYLKNFDLHKMDEAQDLEEFEKSLEKACYHIKKIVLIEDEKRDFLDKFNVTVLDISSYDLEGRNKDSENRLHTDLWNALWKNTDKQSSKETKVKGFSIGKIRLNPEIKIRYQKANKDLKAYFIKKKFPDQFKHRRLKDQFTIHFTLALNAGKLYEDLAFAKTEELLEKIGDFNKRLEKERDFNTTWRYGIDRGEIELATLCLVRFDKEFQKPNGEIKANPDFSKEIECWTLKNYDYSKEYTTRKNEIKQLYAIKNLSYFIDEKYLDDEKLFKKERTSCLDLTTAKVIKGRVITNGDVMTYLKLKKEVAKRRLYELYYSREIDEGALLKWSNWQDGDKKKERLEGVLNIKTSKGEKTVYWYCEKYEGILINQEKNIKYSQQSVESSLKHYLDELKKKEKMKNLTPDNSEQKDDHTPPILKINHLRAAITANMVGVISFLKKSYPGFVILEDLKKGESNHDFFNNNINIVRRLENALYSKFQSLGLVPPHVKDIIRLRKDNKDKLSQIGAIIFVDEKNTSKNCPYCEKTQKNDGDLKFKQHRFVCKDCGFDTYLFKPKEKWAKNHKPEVKESDRNKFVNFKDINDPDKVAAYNIAKESIKFK